MFPVRTNNSKTWLYLTAFGILGVIVGIIIATNLNLSTPSQAQSGRQAQPAAGEHYRSPFVFAAEKVSPAVVNISARITEERSQQKLPFDDEFLRRFFGYVPNPRERRSMQSQSLGSGFIYSPDGYILTNNHVISGGGSNLADKISVKLADGTEYQAQLVGRDPETDIAILKIKAKKDLPYVELGDSDSLHVGEWAIAIGNPFPQFGLDRSLTVGVVSATGRKGLDFGGEQTPYIQNYIQTDAAINPGNSGGPLVNIEGKVIGINAAITSPNPGGGNVGIGFAIPVNLVKQVMPQLSTTGTVARGYLGIQPTGISQDAAEALHLNSTKGVLVEHVQPGTPADEAGLKVGDVVTKLDGQEVSDEDEFRRMIAGVNPGKKVELDILREGQAQKIRVKLGERESLASQTAPRNQNETQESWMGVSVRTSTRSVAEQYGVQFDQGVIVTDVAEGSVAEDKGLEPGDLILKIDGQRVINSETFSQITSNLKKSTKAVSVLIKRGEEGRTLFFALKNGESLNP